MSKSSAAAPSATSPVLDFIGRQITVGSTIVYPVRRGSEMWMQKIKVTQVVGGETPTINGFNDGGRRITVHNVKNVVVVAPVTPTVPTV